MVARGTITLLLAMATMLAGGCADPGGTLVTLTLSANVEDHGEAHHFELFAGNDSPDSLVSLVRFEFRVPPASESIVFQKQVVEHGNPTRVLGVVDGFDRFLRPIGGIRFRATRSLENATRLLITRESNDDRDPLPSEDIVIACDLAPGGRGTLTCPLTNPDKTFILGSATLVPPADTPHPL